MEGYGGVEERRQPRREVRTSFFTRKLCSKLAKKGTAIPASVVAFLDTPVNSFNEKMKAYFEEHFRPQIPSIVNVLSEIFDEIGADLEGWGDMITINGETDTPIKICARAVLERKGKEKGRGPVFDSSQEQGGRRLGSSSQFQQLNPTAC
jgi:hypothetical protein